VIRTITRVDSAGWRLDAHVVDTAEGSVIYGPIWNGEETRAQLGNPVAFVAPNHYHHLGLPKVRALFPEARVFASNVAIPRLKKQGHADIAAIEEARLPRGVRAIPCAGTKNGETWLFAEEARTLIVGDAFFNVPGPLRGVVGALLRATRTGPGFTVGRTFGWLGLRDRAAYRAFAIETLRRERPTTIAFCHGENLVGDDVIERCVSAIERYLQ
jgi:glyoxylase-like metal-dependent hydrolase (beta-lactamase superfamily II)